MLWFSLALITALVVAGRDVSVKVLKDLQPLEIAGLELFWSLPILTVGCLLIPIPTLDQTFWWNFILSFPLNITAYFLYLYAIKHSPISLTVPLLALTPVFMIMTGWLILGEKINLWGGAGIFLIFIGSYTINFNRSQNNYFTPFTAIFDDRGSRFMMIVAFIFAFAAVLGKQGMIHSSPLFFSFFFFLIFNIVILLALFLAGNLRLPEILTGYKKGIWLGSLLVTHIGCHGLAISISPAVYMVAVKRSSILFSVLLSWLILHEGEKKTRGLGTLLMFAGVLLITLLG
ncbi:MAG: DMT family transporter [Proteobacteria bacterium]|nr:DMT family transporter [Pseudomonadota bacterium]MBU1714941.1 DMT family transporter [Pseudomonadota bacterium]